MNEVIRYKAAMELLRFLMQKELGKDSASPVIEVEKLNEVLLVAGEPLVVPGRLEKKELEVIV